MKKVRTWPVKSFLAIAFFISACAAQPARDIVGQRQAQKQGETLDQRCPTGTDACGPAFGTPLGARVEPIDRFENLFSVIHRTVANKISPTEIGDLLQTDEIRRTTLLLEALYKEYLQLPLAKNDHQAMERGRESIKDLEDAIGQRTRVDDLIATAKLGGGSEKLIRTLQRDSEKAANDYFQELQKTGWLPKPDDQLQKLRQSLADFEFARKRKDQRQQVGALMALADGFRSDGKAMDRYFKPKDFSAKDLDNGLHALRRNLRWITSAIQASSGLYAYTTGSPSKRLSDLEAKYGVLKYVQLSPPTKGAYLIDRETMLLLTRYVTELGALKDFKEAELDLSEVINRNDLARNAGSAESMAFAIVTKKFGPLEVESAARKLYAEYLKSDPLKRLKEDLQAQLDGEPVDRD